MTPESAPPTVARWYYIRDRKKIGPLTLEELRELVATEKLCASDMVLKEGEPRWCAAGEVPGLLPPVQGLQTTVDDVTQEDHHRTAAAVEAAPSTAPPPPEARAKLPAVPGYEVQSILGRGGMGVVYKARQVKANRLVALKMILLGAQASGLVLERFRSEAEAVARLQHPRIVQIFEVGDHAGLPFFSLEFVDGGTLANKLHGKPLAPREAAQLVEALAQGIQAAHQAGVVHRDLKPANVLLTRHGEPKITDFGLAKRLDDDSGRTTEGAIMGTPSYMAPEQAAGRVQELGPAVDVYALGAILYECLTGRPPFLGATLLETLEQVRAREPVPPTQLQPKTPRDLETICLKCLQKETRKRYASATELAADLRRYLNGEPIHARPVGSVERAVKWARRRPAVAGLLAVVAGLAVLVAVVGVAGLVGILWNWQEAREARADADKKRQRAEDLEKVTRKKNQELLHQAYITNIASAARALEDNDVLKAEAYLRACPTSLRGWEWHYLSRCCRATLYAVRGAQAVAFTADSKQLLALTSTQGVRRFEAATGRNLGTLALDEGAHQRTMYVSQNGTRLAIQSQQVKGGQVLIYEWPSGLVLRDFHDFPGELTAVALSPDGDRLAAYEHGKIEGELKVWQVGTGQMLCNVKGIKTLLNALSFSSDSKQLAGGGQDGSVRLWDAATGQQARTFAGHDAAVQALAFTPDGYFLISGGKDRLLKAWNLSVNEPPWVFRGHAKAVLAIAVSADGERILSGGDDGSVKVWDTFGKEVRSYYGHARPVTSVAFSPDGAYVASSDSLGTRVWDAVTPPGSASMPLSSVFSVVALSPDGDRLVTDYDGKYLQVRDRVSGRLLMSLGSGITVPTALSYRADGKEIASGDGNGGIHLWDAANGQVVREIAGPGAIIDLVYSPDGRRLASRRGLGLGKDTLVQVFDVATGQQLCSRSGSDDESCHGLAFSPDGQTLAVAGEPKHPERVLLMEAASGRTLRLFEGHKQNLVDLDWRGDRIASVDRDSIVLVWEPDTGAVALTTSVSPFIGIGRIAMSPDGSRVAVATMLNKVSLLELTEGKEVFTTSIENSLPLLAYSKDGRYLAFSQKSREVCVLDGGPSSLVWSLRGHKETGETLAVAFSPDGRFLAGGHKQVSVWDASSGEELAPFPQVHNNFRVMAFSPDQQTLAAGSFNLLGHPEPGEVKVWDVETRQELLTFREHTRNISDLAYSPDGRRIASASEDRSVKVWDVRTGRVELNFTNHQGIPHAVAFSHNGTKIASSCADNKVRMWDAVTGQQLFVHQDPDLQKSFGKLVFSRDDKYLIEGGARLRVLDAVTGQEVRTIGTAGDGDCTALALSLDGQRLATLNEAGVVLWDFASGREVARFGTVAIYQVSLAFNPDGTRLAVGSGPSLDVFDVSAAGLERAAAQHREAAARLVDWHIYRGNIALQKSFGISALHHFSTLLALEPKNAGHYANRADAQVLLGRWDAAAADLNQALTFAPDELTIIYRQALLYLQAGNTDAYRLKCASLLARFGQTTDPERATLAAWICCLAPDAVSDRKLLVELAQRGLVQPLTSYRVATLGAALHRAGRPEEAVPRLREAIQLQKDGGEVESWLQLALAYLALGQKDKAKECLAAATAQQAKYPTAYWQRRKQRELLRAEAERLLKDKEP